MPGHAGWSGRNPDEEVRKLLAKWIRDSSSPIPRIVL